VSIDRRRLRWNGWGRPGEERALSPARARWLLDALAQRLGGTPEPPPAPVALEDVVLPASRLDESVLKRLRQACGEDAVSTETADRVLHATGRSLPDLLRLRRGEIEHAPDAVVWPRDERAVAEALRIAVESEVAVVPFGGGTSVVGGVEPRPSARQAGAISLDTTRLDAALRIDPAGGTATFQAGVDGPALEAALRERGLTLGHFPQSFEQSTLGGWIAARSSGQQSNGYGSIEDLLVAVRLMTPEGVVRTLELPRSAAGPDLNALALGSEGTLGVVTEATLRVSPAPTCADDRGMLFRRFEDGVAAVREMVRSRVGVGLLRLSDGAETELARQQRRDPGHRLDPVELVFRALDRIGYASGSASLLLYGAEGRDEAAVTAAVQRARAIGRAHGGFALGRSPGRSWRRDRFHAPYLRDWLLDHGVAVDTFETAFPWRDVLRGHAEVTAGLARAAEAAAGGGIAMAHLSHSYLDGACLYFTVLYRLDARDGVAQWKALKRAVTDAIVDAGGTLSHHHGVGLDHAAWLGAEKGELGVAALDAVKRRLDPTGVMNPGKWL
jgi:alkyldihydroxyacetonephosphate synthase